MNGASTLEVGKNLVAMCREGRHMEVIEKYYHADIESIEPRDNDGSVGEGRIVKGKDAVRGKSEWWFQTFEPLSGDTDGPFPHGDDRFAVIFNVDIKERATGNVSHLEEVAVYTVQDGQIIKEEFFYGSDM